METSQDTILADIMEAYNLSSHSPEKDKQKESCPSKRRKLSSIILDLSVESSTTQENPSQSTDDAVSEPKSGTTRDISPAANGQAVPEGHHFEERAKLLVTKGIQGSNGNGEGQTEQTLSETPHRIQSSHSEGFGTSDNSNRESTKALLQGNDNEGDAVPFHDADLPVIQSVTSLIEKKGQSKTRTQVEPSEKKGTTESNTNEDEASLSGDESDCLVIDLSLSGSQGGEDDLKNSSRKERTKKHYAREPIPEATKSNELSSDTHSPTHHGIMSLFGLCSENSESTEQADMSYDILSDEPSKEPEVTNNAEIENIALAASNVPKTACSPQSFQQRRDERFSDQETRKESGCQHNSTNKVDSVSNQKKLSFKTSKETLSDSTDLACVNLKLPTRNKDSDNNDYPQSVSPVSLVLGDIRHSPVIETNPVPLLPGKGDIRIGRSILKPQTNVEISISQTPCSVSTTSAPSCYVQTSVGAEDRGVRKKTPSEDVRGDMCSTMKTPTIGSDPGYTMASENATALTTLKVPKIRMKAANKGRKRQRDQPGMLPSVVQTERLPTHKGPGSTLLGSSPGNQQMFIPLPNFLQIQQPNKGHGQNKVQCFTMTPVPGDPQLQGYVMPSNVRHQIIQPSLQPAKAGSTPMPALGKKFTYRPVFPVQPRPLGTPITDTVVSLSSGTASVGQIVQPSPTIKPHGETIQVAAAGSEPTTTVLTSSVKTTPPGVTVSTQPITTTFKAQAIIGTLREKLLSKNNMVPEYRPTTPPAGIDRTFTPYHACLGCEDVFTNRSNLDYHRSRRSLFIRYTCIVCAGHFLFFNKCLLREHLVLHNRKYAFDNSGLTSAVVIPIPSHLLQMHFDEQDSKGDKQTTSGSSTATLNSDSCLRDETRAEGQGSGSCDGGQKANPRKTPDHLVAVQSRWTEVSQNVAAAGGPTGLPTPINVTSNIFSSSVFPTTATTTASSTTVTATIKDKTDKPEKGTSQVIMHDVSLELPQKPQADTSNKIKAVRCAECKHLFKDLSLLDLHMHDPGPEPVKCPLESCCMMEFTGPCSLKAHQRLHGKKPPHVCPECGRVFRGSTQLMDIHLQNHCYHYCRAQIFLCPRCHVGYKKMLLLYEHILETHAESYFKCQQCPMAFRSPEIFKSHAASHPVTSVQVTGSKGESKLMKLNAEKLMETIFKCPLCDTVFHTEKRQRIHISEHITKLKAKIGFRCRLTDCSYAFESREDLERHMNSVHKFPPKGEMCDLCIFTAADEQGLDEHLRIAHCTIQANTFFFQGTKSSMLDTPKPSGLDVTSKSRGKKGLKAKRKGKRKNSTESSSHEEQIVTLKAVSGDEQPVEKVIPEGMQEYQQVESLTYLCHLCDNRYLIEEELSDHLQQDHSVKTQFLCQLCGNAYERKDQLEKHFKAAHEGRTRDLPFMCWICKGDGNAKGYKKRTHLEKHLVNFHKIAKNCLDVNKLNQLEEAQKCDTVKVESEVNQEDEEDAPVLKRLKLDGDSQFKCAKCEFVCEDRSQFVEHVTKHKSTQEVVQCHECGLCFMVLPALKVHLKLVHKIHDLDKYSKEAGVNLENPEAQRHGDQLKVTLVRIPPSSKILLDNDKNTNDVESGSTNDNNLECTVCYKKYESQKGLKNHMRTHGMAFIRSKRLLKAAVLNDLE